MFSQATNVSHPICQCPLVATQMASVKMRCFLLLILSALYFDYCSTRSGFNLYHTHHRLTGADHDCLYYFPHRLNFAYQLIEYCIRSPLDKEIIHDRDKNNSFTFEDLGQRNITSENLYAWSASIDLIEYYQNYLEGNTSLNELTFYNCTYPSFGTYCEYSFAESSTSFDEQVRRIFYIERFDSREHVDILSCYTHLECNHVGHRGQTLGACLGWREVCDGQVDCIDGGQDEEFCWHLEINECDEKKEFRCQNGMCIPLPFLYDDEINPDCLDQSDEPLNAKIEYVDPGPFYTNLKNCWMDSVFRCEDHTRHPSIYNDYRLQCGDGFFAISYHSCKTSRNTRIAKALWLGTNLSENCFLGIACCTGLLPKEAYKIECERGTLPYLQNATLICPKLIVLPPFLFGHVQFVFINNQFQVSTINNE